MRNRRAEELNPNFYDKPYDTLRVDLRVVSQIIEMGFVKEQLNDQVSRSQVQMLEVSELLGLWRRSLEAEVSQFNSVVKLKL